MQKRQTSTKKDIRKTFIGLLNTKGFDNLTVSDLARGSDINRGTFYLHYVDKYDLMEKLEMEVIYDLKQIMLLDNDIISIDQNKPIDLIPYNRIVNALHYIKDDFSFIAALSGKGGDHNFPGLIKDVLKETIQAKIDTFDQFQFSRKDIPEEYAIEILLSGIVAIILVWIDKGGIESPEEIGRMIELTKSLSPNDLLL
ncbi:TetR/AcrR family transcriptional regulator [Listeria monocytogenes]|nr:TetR/AcrR family transcriptional regulator [Listeria monocytogenes]EAC7200506.1 TetR/AcrR family transcriptional regulator [Listeria monocytogenes]EAE1627111.1 TetR/AcrR family transcriptional regulator [Listeria monocytogenes]EAF1346839.1 TetR/AcrR family transcriptional regulator [Listeria monocytogenes]EAF2737813.1 TetR/AcrR family transcriptional regulator [Listeria monocytogenes]